MATLAEAHISMQARLRAIVAAAVGTIWAGLAAYDRQNIPDWLDQVLPLVEAAQIRSVAMTDAYVARALDRAPLGLDPSRLTGAAVRNGTPPGAVYQRPFVHLWSALERGVPWEQAVQQGRDRAVSAAQTDVQLSHLRAYTRIGELDDRIVGWQRVPDANACEFCKLISTRRYHKRTLQPVHPHCGCGVAPITEAIRGEFFGKRENDVFHDLPDGVAVHEHGELGPVVADPAHAFTSEQDF